MCKKLILLNLLFALCGATHAADVFPSKPITIVVPFAAGGPNDVLARMLQDPLGKAFGQPVVIENKVGATGIIGTQYVKNAKPDGHTLLVGGTSTITAVMVQKKPSYDPAKDLVPLNFFGGFPVIVLANPSLPAKNMKELIDYAKANPGVINYGTSGPGAISHFGTELLSQKTGVSMQAIPYQGTAPVMIALLQGDIKLHLAAPTAAVTSYIAAGRLRALAITSPKPTEIAPGLPTVAETVPGYSVQSWFGLLAPAGTPPDVLAKIEAAVTTITSSPQWKEKVWTSLGLPAHSLDRQQFRDYFASEIKLWSEVANKGALISE